MRIPCTIAPLSRGLARNPGTAARCLGRALPVWVLCALLLGAGACREAEPPAVAAAPPASPAPAAAPEPAGSAASEPYRGLWVLAEGSERVLEDPERIDRLIERALALDVSDLFVQVYRGGRAWYAAERADATPHREMLARTGVDGLERLLERAHAAGLRVHAWVNVLSLSQNPGAPIVAELGPQAVLVDSRGRSILDYPGFDLPAPDRSWYRMGTPGLYLDPAAPGVEERLVATFDELLARHPALDGLHLDYIRHPGVLPFVPGSRFGVGLDFGYGEASRKRFERDTGLAAANAIPSSRWDDWRRERVTGLVAAIRARALERNPKLLLSAAVIAYADRAYLSLAQDWRGWLEQGLIDFAVPMVYTLDDRLFRYQVESFARGRDAERIWMGIGVWLFAKRPERAVAQSQVVREAGAAGEVLFSYDAMAEAPALIEAFRR